MRRRRPEKRQIAPDPVYGDKQVQKFINYLMLKGKKSTAENIFYGAMDLMQTKTKSDPIELFQKAEEPLNRRIVFRYFVYPLPYFLPIILHEGYRIALEI